MHLRHSAYADLAAQARVMMLESIGLRFTDFRRIKIGPILFREETVYLKEIGPEEVVKISSEMLSSTEDGSRWTIRNVIYRGDDVKAAIVTVEGAWMDVVIRKLASLPEEYARVYKDLPKAEDFVLKG